MKLLAPNGKPSNLTPEQYKLVRTPEFKKWFGDWINSPETASKVVDENGEPMVVYHFTGKDFNVFKTKGLSDGFFFTEKIDDTEFSYEGNKTKSYFLNIKKLSELSDMPTHHWSIPYYENKWIEKSKSGGSDGIQFLREGDNKRIIVAYKPEQIKLADGTNTTFDGSNPDIRFLKGGKLSKTPAPKKERIYGSKINKPKSAESKSKASSIILNPITISSIKSILEKHNNKYPKKRIPISTAKAVVRRGMGAYSSTHRPTISGGKPNSRVAWGLARLNAFVYKIQKGHSKSGKYNQDDDLINELGYRVKKYLNGGSLNQVLSIQEVESKLDRKINSWKDDVIEIEGLKYKKVYLRPEYYLIDSYKIGGQTEEEKKEIYQKWKKLVNMTKYELERFYNSDEGKVAGLTAKEAKEQGIDSGRESARWIMKMKDTPVTEWTPNMWRWAKKQISFISRMSGMKGKLYDEKGRKTRKHLALLIWGNNPEK